MKNFGFRSNNRLLVAVPVALFFGIILLAGCQSIPKQHSDCSQAADINLTDFELSGKLALSDGQEGGSGRFTWRQHDSQVTAQFKAPLGQGDWLIEETDQGATLIINNETPYYALQAETLIEDAVGWSVPWESLKKWLLAQPVDVKKAHIKRTQDAKTITEQGWTIVYNRFQNDSQVCLPHRIMASKPPYSIRLVIRKWQW